MAGREGSKRRVPHRAVTRSTPQQVKTLRDLMPFFGDTTRTGNATFASRAPNGFRAMGIPLVRGRLFDERDSADAPHVALISESRSREAMAERGPDRRPHSIRRCRRRPPHVYDRRHRR